MLNSTASFSINPFPHTRNLKQTTLKTSINIQKISRNYGIITEKGFKTFWQKGKLLVLSNFFFCHNVFKSRLLQMHQNASIGGLNYLV